MKKPFRLLIAVPCTDYMHADFVKSLMNLTGHLQREGIRFHVEIMAGTLVYFARNSLACKAINEDFTTSFSWTVTWFSTRRSWRR